MNNPKTPKQYKKLITETNPKEVKDPKETKPTKRRLTMKQKRWAEIAVKTLNPSEAVRQVYDVANANVSWSMATENLRKPALREYMLQLMEREGYDVAAHSNLIKDGAQATKRDQFTGEVLPDWQNRHKFIDMINKIADVYPSQKVERVSLTANLSDMILKQRDERKLKVLKQKPK